MGIGACNHATLGNMTVINYAMSFDLNEETKMYLYDMEQELNSLRAPDVKEEPRGFLDLWD
jgi:hypothetical protein